MSFKITKIEEEVWWKLNQLKLDWRLRNLSEVINRLIDILKKDYNSSETIQNDSNGKLQEQSEGKDEEF